MTAEKKRLTIGLTGGGGVLGRSLVRSWTDCEWAPFVGDIRSREDIRNWVGSRTFDGVIHLAAVVPVQEVESDFVRAFEVNVGGTVRLLEELRTRTRPLPWFFYASSSHVYGKSDRPLAEGAPLAPPSLYGLTKMQGEQIAAAYGAVTGLEVCIGRIFSFSSPFQPPSYFLPSIIRKVRDAPPGTVIEVPGAYQKRDFLSTAIIADAIRFLCVRRETGALNIGSGAAVTILEAARQVAEALGRDDLRLVPGDESSGGLVADVTEIRSRGWSADFNLSDLIDEMIRGDTADAG